MAVRIQWACENTWQRGGKWNGRRENGMKKGEEVEEQETRKKEKIVETEERLSREEGVRKK